MSNVEPVLLRAHVDAMAGVSLADNLQYFLTWQRGAFVRDQARAYINGFIEHGQRLGQGLQADQVRFDGSRLKNEEVTFFVIAEHILNESLALGKTLVGYGGSRNMLAQFHAQRFANKLVSAFATHYFNPQSYFFDQQFGHILGCVDMVRRYGLQGRNQAEMVASLRPDMDPTCLDPLHENFDPELFVATDAQLKRQVLVAVVDPSTGQLKRHCEAQLSAEATLSYLTRSFILRDPTFNAEYSMVKLLNGHSLSPNEVERLCTRQSVPTVEVALNRLLKNDRGPKTVLDLFIRNHQFFKILNFFCQFKNPVHGNLSSVITFFIHRRGVSNCPPEQLLFLFERAESDRVREEFVHRFTFSKLVDIVSVNPSVLSTDHMDMVFQSPDRNTADLKRLCEALPDDVLSELCFRAVNREDIVCLADFLHKKNVVLSPATLESLSHACRTIDVRPGYFTYMIESFLAVQSPLVNSLAVFLIQNVNLNSTHIHLLWNTVIENPFFDLSQMPSSMVCDDTLTTLIVNYMDAGKPKEPLLDWIHTVPNKNLILDHTFKRVGVTEHAATVLQVLVDYQARFPGSFVFISEVALSDFLQRLPHYTPDMRQMLGHFPFSCPRDFYQDYSQRAGCSSSLFIRENPDRARQDIETLLRESLTTLTTKRGWENRAESFEHLQQWYQMLTRFNFISSSSLPVLQPVLEDVLKRCQVTFGTFHQKAVVSGSDMILMEIAVDLAVKSGYTLPQPLLHSLLKLSCKVHSNVFKDINDTFHSDYAGLVMADRLIQLGAVMTKEMAPHFFKVGFRHDDDCRSMDRILKHMQTRGLTLPVRYRRFPISPSFSLAVETERQYLVDAFTAVFDPKELAALKLSRPDFAESVEDYSLVYQYSERPGRETATSMSNLRKWNNV